MRINTHIFVDIEPRNIEFFSRLGIDLEKHRISEYTDWTCLDIFEDDPLWPAIWQQVKHRNQPPMKDSVFTKEEVRAASFVTPIRCWQNGYPQPEDDYDTVTYDSSHRCKECGTGLVQKAPFRLRGEPKWGRRSLMGLNWVWDEIFTTPTVWREVFRPFGIDCMPVLKNKTGEVLETCVQLKIDATVDLDIPKSHPSEYCHACKVTGWKVSRVGPFPGPAGEPSAAIFKSTQYFGTGHQPFREVLLSKALYAEIERHGLKGIEFGACADETKNNAGTLER